jgi:putative transposase
LVRKLAASEHVMLDGTIVKYSRPTIDRWIRAYRKGGFKALYPPKRVTYPRTPAETLKLGDALRREDPFRTAAQISKIVTATNGWSPSSRTFQRYFSQNGLTRAKLTGKDIVFGRFEANYPNELWVGDALHCPPIENKKVVLFCFLDDHSRLVAGFSFFFVEDTLSAMAALRRGILSRGLPGIVYLDNGSPFVARQFLRALSVLNIRIVHSKPGRPEGRGKIERFFRTVRDQFIVEIKHSDIDSLEVLNERFLAYLETTYHRSIHSETGEKPIERFMSKAEIKMGLRV